MGETGARLTGTALEVADALVDDLAAMPDVTSKRMFGGVGIFSEGKMFVIVDSTGKVYLRADASTTDAFLEAGGEKHGRMPYWSVPSEVLNDGAQLLTWAQRARDVAFAP